MISPMDVLHGKILIVDDQEANVLLLEQMLRGGGYDCITSTMDPSQVCELHLVHHYDLILLDLQMPGMDGFQVMENLKEIEVGSYLPVLVITAQPEHKLRALRAGAKDFVSKPFDLSEVLLRVHNLLEVRLLHVEMKKLYEQVLSEQRVSERLLRGALPDSIADCLKGNPDDSKPGSPALITEGYAEVTVLFTDILEFTTFCEGSSAEALKGVLEDLSTRFDGYAETPGIPRARTIEDAYLASAGFPGPVVDHSIHVAHKALEMAQALDRFNERSRYKLKLRIGLDIGADLPVRDQNTLIYDL